MSDISVRYIVACLDELESCLNSILTLLGVSERVFVPWLQENREQTLLGENHLSDDMPQWLKGVGWVKSHKSRRKSRHLQAKPTKHWVKAKHVYEVINEKDEVVGKQVVVNEEREVDLGEMVFNSDDIIGKEKSELHTFSIIVALWHNIKL